MGAHNTRSRALLFSRYLQLYYPSGRSSGFALPMAVILGLIMVTFILASVLQAQSSRDSAQTRQASGASSIVSDSAIARVLVELSKPGNTGLLVRNYDPKNPKTGQNYLGADGLVDSGDETNTEVNEWSGYDPSALPCYQEKGVPAPNVDISGTIGSQGAYKILAYRYSPESQEGKVLVEGTFQGIPSHILLTISIHPELDDFPGIALIDPDINDEWIAGTLALRGRELLGAKSNVYLIPESSADPTITGRSVPGDPDRDNYLNAVWSSDADGATVDTMSTTAVACNLNIKLPEGKTGTNLGTIDSATTLAGTNAQSPTVFEVDKIDLAGTDTLTIDTTDGPVVIELIDSGKKGVDRIILRDTAKILNVRTDGQPPQVGDVRIMIRTSQRVVLYDQTCIQQVFLYSHKDELRLLTSGPGCPSGQNTNFEGVAWVEAILSSKNSVTNRNIEYLGHTNHIYDTLITPAVTSGIAVPDHVSSLSDLLQYTDLPITYRYGDIKQWQQVRL